MYIALALALACSDGEQAKPEDAAPTEADLVVTQPESEDALATVVRVVLQDLQARQDGRAIKTIESWALSDPKKFFLDHFTADVSEKLVADYDEQASHITEIADVLKKQLDKGRDQVSVQRIASAEDERAVGLQRIAIVTMTNRTPLYSVRLTAAGSDDGYHLWSFVHDGRSFRWLGKLRPLMPKTQDLDKLELRLEHRRESSK